MGRKINGRQNQLICPIDLDWQTHRKHATLSNEKTLKNQHEILKVVTGKVPMQYNI